ncbi:MAG: phosphatidylserine decarboxylase [Helicobacteraceae bacterium]|nr:phosphatidylserine decarboxylase [Helicobacteraceae bacterium]
MNLTKIVSICFGIIADIRFYKPLQNFINKTYIKAFDISLDRFQPYYCYKSLNELFTRGLREIVEFDKKEDIFISPSDSFVMQSGSVSNNRALQIKGFSYSVESLLKDKLDSSFSYVNLYLSPKDYHRYHSPCDMEVVSITHFKGALLPVHKKSLNKNTNLFVRNERVVLKARDRFGDYIYFVAVGALNVGKIIFYIEPRLCENYRGKSRKFLYKQPRLIKKGDELGMFKMGSTIVLFAKNVEILKDNIKVSFGEKLFKKLVESTKGDKNGF